MEKDNKKFFPKFKESEDERVRKAILTGLIDCRDAPDLGWSDFGGITIDECINWLEKQVNTSDKVTCTQEVEVGNGNPKALVTEELTLTKIEATKSYTDLEQSKKLAKILPIWDSDMWYEDSGLMIPRLGHMPIEHTNTEVPCWSVTALLNILPTGKVLLHDKGNRGYKCICNNMDTGYFNNPVDACVAMILKLHEHKML